MANVLKLFYPVEPFKYRITQLFGENPQWYPLTNGHNGIDWGLPMRTKIFATLPGTVIRVASDPNGYGNHIRIKHDNNLMSLYGHLDENNFSLVQVDDHVRTGQHIGFSGNTGRSTGPHLHYEVRRGNKAFDTQSFLVTQVDEEEETTPPAAILKGRVLASATPFLNVRSGPDVLYPVVDTIQPGTEFEIYDFVTDTIWLHTSKGFLAMRFKGNDFIEFIEPDEHSA